MANHTMRGLLSRLDVALSSSMEWIRNEKQIELSIPSDLKFIEYQRIKDITGASDISDTHTNMTVSIAYNIQTENRKFEPLHIKFPNGTIWTCTSTPDENLQEIWRTKLSNANPSAYAPEWDSNGVIVIPQFSSTVKGKLRLSFKPPQR